MNDSLRTNPPGRVRVASLGVRDVEPVPGLSESPATTSDPATGAYRVSEGDTLWRLARNYGITVDEILAVNPNLGPDGRIRTREVIRVPMPERTGTGPGSDEIITIVIPPPLGSSAAPAGAPSAGAPSAGAQARSEEGWGSFFEGAIKGDFSDNDSRSKAAGQFVAGVVPFVGQAADARDTLAALNQVREGRPGGWLSLFTAAIGWVPGAGDALKGAIRGGRKVAGEVAEAAIEQGTRRVGSEAAGEVGERAAQRTSDAGASSTIAPASGESSRPSWLDDVERGTNFNKARAFDYPYREVYIERPGGGYYRLDAYDPFAGEIVSWKNTNLSQITEGTAIDYLNELVRKYPPNARIASVPSSGPLAGQPLRGQMILEVPPQTRPIPRAVLDYATAKRIVIRDVYGNVYN